MKRKIGERIGSTEKRFSGLTRLRASSLNKKNSVIPLLDHELAVDVLNDNDEIEFDLESDDLWLHVVMALFGDEELIIYGSTDVRVDKRELL